MVGLASQNTEGLYCWLTVWVCEKSPPQMLSGEVGKGPLKDQFCLAAQEAAELPCLSSSDLDLGFWVEFHAIWHGT